MSRIKFSLILIAALLVSFVTSPTKSEASVYPAIAAYQESYAMNFEVWKPYDLPAGWYATFDGFPVAQIAENRWVYGKQDIYGALTPTNVLVGSVIPSNVPGLARISSTWTYGLPYDSPEFMKILDYMCNRMGWLYLPEQRVNTIIAWNTHKVGVWIWLGNRWKRFEPRSNEYTWQMLKRLAPYVARELEKNHVWYIGGEPAEVADLARQWGIIWGGRVVLEKLKSYEDRGGGNDSGTVTSMRSESSSSSSGSSSGPRETKSNPSPQWDVD